MINPNKPGRVRVVCHANERTGGLSLNERLYKGPDNLLNLSGVLLRLREERYAVSGDVAKMFLQVRVKPEDGPALRYHWLPYGETGPPHIYQMDMQVFGLISSPSVCTFAMRQTAIDHAEEYPGFHQEMCRSFYADNFLKSYASEKEALLECQKMTALLKLGGFPLQQWCSNSRMIMEAFPGQLSSKPNLDLDLEGLPMERVLGLVWDCQTDEFVLTIQTGNQYPDDPDDSEDESEDPDDPEVKDRKKKKKKWSRRELLSMIGKVFDPLGLLSPLVIQLKLIFRDTKHSISGWDQKLEKPLLVRWKQWITSLESLATLRVPRCLQPFDAKPISTQLHAFSDASQNAFGGCVYMRL